MILFPNCKINLGLNILCKREDGFHDLETVFYPLPLMDVVEAVEAKTGGFILPTSQLTDVDITISGTQPEGRLQDNLCVKAYRLLKKDFPNLPPIQLHLYKAIPAGAGLGGGSSDGTFTLKLLNEKLHLNLSNKQLGNYALELGSDCPFFVLNRPCIASGRGEILEEIKITLKDYDFLLIHPGIHINTGWAFSQLRLAKRPQLPGRLKEIVNQPIETWEKELQNDFEAPVFAEYPEIKSIKEILYNMGGLYASLSGSGSAVFGIFPKEVITGLNFPAHYFVKKLAGQ